jgi:hypothetical protein
MSERDFLSFVVYLSVSFFKRDVSYREVKLRTYPLSIALHTCSHLNSYSREVVHFKAFCNCNNTLDSLSL